MSFRHLVIVAAATLLAAVQIEAIRAQQTVKGQPAPGDWPTFSHDLAGLRYSPLTQVNTRNVSQLKLAWRMPFRSSPGGPAAGFGLTQAMPIVVNNVMYVP